LTLDDADALAHATLEDAIDPEFLRGQAEVTHQFRESYDLARTKAHHVNYALITGPGRNKRPVAVNQTLHRLFRGR
jgi:hypothetical protein